MSKPATKNIRNERGAILPFVVFTLMVSIAFLGLAVDVMRTIHAAGAIQYASQASALYAYQCGFTANGDLKNGNFDTNNVMQELQVASGSNGSPWNLAPAGPNGVTTQTAVQFDGSDVNVLTNPNDSGDYFLQVTARRNGSDGLTMFFLPAIFAFNSLVGLPVPPNVNKANPFRTTEVVMQPASRIGAGLPSGMWPVQADPRLIGHATFPLAISNKQFLTASQQTQANYVVELVSKQNPFTGATNHIQGAYVNVYNDKGALYYGAGQGTVALNQLYGTLSYFSNPNAANALPPGVVERGSSLVAFDPNDSIYQQQAQTLLLPRLKSVPLNSFYILPVLHANPAFGGASNIVIGFARVALTRINIDPETGIATSLNVTIGPSYPMANASVGTGLSSVPSVTMGASLLHLDTATEKEFLPRPFDGPSNSIAARPFGVVMAPALSPRSLEKGGPL